MRTIVLLPLLFCVYSCSSYNASVTKECVGNFETFDKKIIQAGVSYKLHYELSGALARVQFAGREFDAQAEKGTSWKGLWIKKMDGSPIGYIPKEGGTYFSYLPEEGGIIKFQFEPQKWFSGNC
jgi:hypothetical protein